VLPGGLEVGWSGRGGTAIIDASHVTSKPSCFFHSSIYTLRDRHLLDPVSPANAISLDAVLQPITSSFTASAGRMVLVQVFELAVP
jgi:hypothetical protein